MFSTKRSNFCTLPPVVFLLVRQLLMADASSPTRADFLSRVYIYRFHRGEMILSFLFFCFCDGNIPSILLKLKLKLKSKRRNNENVNLRRYKCCLLCLL